MTEVFGAYMDKFLKVFVGDLNVHSLKRCTTSHSELITSHYNG
jgi:hypothetical protein